MKEKEEGGDAEEKASEKEEGGDAEEKASEKEEGGDDDGDDSEGDEGGDTEAEEVKEGQETDGKETVKEGAQDDAEKQEAKGAEGGETKKRSFSNALKSKLSSAKQTTRAKLSGLMTKLRSKRLPSLPRTPSWISKLTSLFSGGNKGYRPLLRFESEAPGEAFATLLTLVAYVVVTVATVVVFIACKAIGWGASKLDQRRIEMQDDAMTDEDKDPALTKLYEEMDDVGFWNSTHVRRTTAAITLCVHFAIFFILYLTVVIKFMMLPKRWTVLTFVRNTIILVLAYFLLGAHMWIDATRNVVINLSWYLYGASAIAVCWPVFCLPEMM